MAINNITNPSAAANAYASMAKTAQAPGIEATGKGETFSDFVKQAATESVQVLEAGEKASAQAVLGNASLTEIVESVTAAELTLQTVVAVRDKMLQAYQDIMRMPI